MLHVSFLATMSLLFPQVCGVVVRCLEDGLGAFCALYLKSSDIVFLIDLIKMGYLPLLLKINKHIYIYIYDLKF